MLSPLNLCLNSALALTFRLPHGFLKNMEQYSLFNKGLFCNVAWISFAPLDNNVLIRGHRTNCYILNVQLYKPKPYKEILGRGHMFPPIHCVHRTSVVLHCQLYKHCTLIYSPDGGMSYQTPPAPLLGSSQRLKSIFLLLQLSLVLKVYTCTSTLLHYCSLILW